MNRFLIPLIFAATAFPAVAQDFPDIYLRGECNGWSAEQNYRLSREGNVYSIHLDKLNGDFKLASSDWNTVDLGASAEIDNQGVYPLFHKLGNIHANNLTDVTLSITYDPANYEQGQQVTNLYVLLDADPSPNPFPEPGPTPDPNPTPDPTPEGVSGTLPVLYINVYTDESHSQLNNEIISKDLDHKNYFKFAEYRLDTNGCQWLIDLGATDLGSADEMLPLQIKARGNWTRKGFSKKPFKLKLDKKASMLGMSKSKHYAILAHADDWKGYLKNFTGFNLGKRMGLPWTPGMQPIEVVINGDYRGLYFLTESIRVEEDRVNITELADNETDNTLASGGYLVELDNYDEDNQIRMQEKTCTYVPVVDNLRITFDTPEEYSDIQRRFIEDQFSAMNDAVGNNSDNLWSYMDIDDAARYYLVEEIISHYEAYHGSTYLFRDFGEGQKWHFSPLWDCGHAFDGPTDDFFYNFGPYGNTWIPSMRCNEAFNNKVKDTWLWFMSNRFDGIMEDIDLYASRLKSAAEADFKRWNGQPTPNGGQAISDNRNMDAKANYVKILLSSKINWLKNQFGDYSSQTFPEPERDSSPAAPLPDYVKPAVTPEPTPEPEPEPEPDPVIPTNYPEIYLLGETNNWTPSPDFLLSREENTYSIHLDRLDGKFKFASAGWDICDLGCAGLNEVSHSSSLPLVAKGGDFVAHNLYDVTFSFAFAEGMTESTLQVITNGQQDPNPDPEQTGISGSLPVLYINVYTDESHSQLNNEIISKDLDHKNYFQFAEYRLDTNGCQWLIDLGATDLGSADEMLPLQIKARGNWTRKGFSKKPFKLKLDKKASMLGMSKSKHYAILAHADDETGYLKNFTGFNLGKRMELPWTPGMQPIEVVINGDYRGLYFLTESIRVEEDRVNITELADNETDNTLASGGYLVELDNYDEDNQIRMQEKVCTFVPIVDYLRVTFDTPEEYSDIQRRFIEDQFSAMNDAVGNNSDDLWSFMDMDDAARYYLVEEIISHYEAYHGSTYLFRDFGEGQKWHFSPLWDCGNAFRAPTDCFFYEHGVYGNTWIPSMRCNEAFNNKVKDTWLWFMSNRFDGIMEDIDLYASRLKSAAEADFKRWDGQPTPNGGQSIADNRDMTAKAEYVKNHLSAKINWLKNHFGDYSADIFPEPERDTTPAMPLPDYLLPEESGVRPAVSDDAAEPVRYFNLQGIEVNHPDKGLYIKVEGNKASKITK